MPIFQLARWASENSDGSRASSSPAAVRCSFTVRLAALKSKDNCPSGNCVPPWLRSKSGRDGKNVKNGSVTLPDSVPVMPLPGAVLFPHALLPLYIFEPRYQEMLQHALEQHRIFCVTLIKPSCPEWHAPEDFFHVATAGLIRACVGRDDGTSNLILQGLHRVRFAGCE